MNSILNENGVSLEISVAFSNWYEFIQSDERIKRAIENVSPKYQFENVPRQII